MYLIHLRTKRLLSDNHERRLGADILKIAKDQTDKGGKLILDLPDKHIEVVKVRISLNKN